MMIQAVLSNPSHPEYGVATIPFPIPRDQYAHCMELLAAMEIGDAVKADCKVTKIDSFYTVLKRTEMLMVNVEELNYTAVATYSGSATSSYVKGYTVTADYTGTVSRIALNRVRYVAIFEGTPIQPTEPAETPATASAFRWSYVLIPIGIVAAAGAGVGGALLVKHRKENADEEDTE